MNLAMMLLSAPTPLLVLLVISTTLILVAGSVLFVRRQVHLSVLEMNNEYKDLVVGGLCVFYAVLLAFVVLVVWEEYREVRDIVEGESNKIGDLLRNVEGFPESFDRKMQLQIRDYSAAVVADWNETALGGPGVKSRDAFDSLWLLYQSYEPANPREEAIFSEGLTRLSELREQRRLRLLRDKAPVPAALWFVLVIGAVSSVGSTLFFGLRNIRAQIALTAMMAVMINLTLLVIFVFEHPFFGDICIDPEPFLRQIEEAERFLRL